MRRQDAAARPSEHSHVEHKLFTLVGIIACPPQAAAVDSHVRRPYGVNHVFDLWTSSAALCEREYRSAARAVRAAVAADMVAGDAASNARLQAQFGQACSSYRAAATSRGSAGWTCWAPGSSNPDAAGKCATHRDNHHCGLGRERSAEPYLWTFSQTAYYGTTRKILGSVLVEAQVSMNGRQSRNKMTLTRFTGPAIRQSLSIDCRYEADDASCGDRAHAIAPTYDNESFPLSKNYFHTLGHQYYTDFNYYFGSLGNRKSLLDGRFFHVPALHSAVFTCRTTNKLCKF